MMVGRITKENFVAQSDEAVIGYGVKPISSLVKDPHLHHLLECSMMDYIRKQCSGKYTYINNIILLSLSTVVLSIQVNEKSFDLKEGI